VWMRDLAIGVCRPGFRRRTRRHHLRPVSSRGSENAVVPNEVEPRRRDQRGELRQQLQGFESDVSRAVAPAVFEFVEQPLLTKDRGSAHRKGWLPRQDSNPIHGG